MVLFSRIIVGFGAFLIVTGVAYGASTYEWEGVTLMIIVAGGALLVGVYLVSGVRRARAVLAAGEARREGAESEPHVAPTIWPLVFSLATIGLVVGAVVARWALVAGGVLFVVASVGWVLDVRRQWQHHTRAAPHEATPHTASGHHTD